MNLKAAMATRMRLNMWEGNFDEAYDDAFALRDTYTLTWVSRTDLERDENKRDLTFSKEMIFGLEAFQRFDDIIDVYFRRLASDNLNSNSQFLSLPSERATEIYEEALKDADWRYIYWWGEKSEDNFAFFKFREVDNMTYTNNVALIKSAEICYTEAECLLRAGGESNKNLAIEALNRVREQPGALCHAVGEHLDAGAGLGRTDERVAEGVCGRRTALLLLQAYRQHLYPLHFRDV